MKLRGLTKPVNAAVVAVIFVSVNKMKIDFKFLDDYACYVDLNANDTFGYACADTTTIDVQELPGVIELERLFGIDGVTAFMAHKRQADPIPPHITKKYKEARKYIQENFVGGEHSEEWIPKKYLYDKAYDAKGFVILDRKKLDSQDV